MELLLDSGISKVLTNENIAIVVMMVIILMQQVLIGFLLNGLLKVKDVLAKLDNTITLLLERISHHADN